MEDNYYIKTLLEKIESADPKSFSQFAHEHPICFQEKKGNWLFPMMFDFYMGGRFRCTKEYSRSSTVRFGNATS